MSESPISSCENCGGKVKRLITGGTGLIFKGSGFYLTDYKNGKNPQRITHNQLRKKMKIQNRLKKTKIRQPQII